MADNPTNRRRCDTAMKRIDAEIVLGTFDYAAYFPDGGKVEVFAISNEEWRRQNPTRRCSATLPKLGSPNAASSGGDLMQTQCASHSTNISSRALATRRLI